MNKTKGSITINNNKIKFDKKDKDNAFYRDHPYNKFVTSKEGLEKGAEIDGIFRNYTTRLANKYKFEFHKLHDDTFNPQSKKKLTNPDFVSKHLWIECKYSKYGCLYDTNIYQLKKYYEMYSKYDPDCKGYLYIVDENRKNKSLYDVNDILNIKLQKDPGIELNYYKIDHLRVTKYGYTNTLDELFNYFADKYINKSFNYLDCL